MKRITTLKQLKSLPINTVVIQLYHKKSCDDSKFDINLVIKDGLNIIEEIGGFSNYKNIKTKFIDIYS